MPCGSVDQEVAFASDFAVMVMNKPLKEDMQDPENDLSNGYSSLYMQWMCIVSTTHICVCLRMTKHTCQDSQDNKSNLRKNSDFSTQRN